MIEVGAVIMMILGLVSAFIGVTLTLAASREIKNILEEINDLKTMFQRHEEKG